MNIHDERRFGYLSIPFHDIMERDPDFRPKMRAIMSEIIVLRAEYMLHNNRLEYTAWSEHFDEVPPGEIPPHYHVIYHNSAIRFEKQE